MPQDESINGRLISFAISNGARAAATLPSRLKLLSWGKNETVKGPVTVGPRTLKELAANQAKLGFDKIALDYNHQTVPSSPNYRPDPVQVAAYGTAEVIEGEGLFLNITDWTPSGRENAANYHDLSPTPQLDANGEVIFLHSVALCRQGAVDGLTFYTASIDNPASLKPHAATSHKKPSMDYRASLLALLKKLGVNLPDNPSDAEIGDAVTAYKPGDTDDDKPSPMTAEFKTLSAEVAGLKASAEAAQRQTIVDRATAAGKVVPLSAEEIAKTPVETLSAMVDRLPVTVPLEARGGKGTQAGTETKVVTLSAAQKQICKKLRIPEERYLQTLQADEPAVAVI